MSVAGLIVAAWLSCGILNWGLFVRQTIRCNPRALASDFMPSFMLDCLICGPLGLIVWVVV